MSTDHDSDTARLARHRDANRTVHPDIVAENQRAFAAYHQRVGELEDIIRDAALELTAGLQYIDRIADTRETSVSYETMQRSGFKRKAGWRRAYKLTDARSDAETAAIRLRNAWELLDPISPARQGEARRTALGNAQEQLQIAIGHLQSMLSTARNFQDQQSADTAARDWLISIGSEPQ